MCCSKSSSKDSMFNKTSNKYKNCSIENCKKPGINPLKGIHIIAFFCNDCKLDLEKIAARNAFSEYDNGYQFEFRKEVLRLSNEMVEIWHCILEYNVIGVDSKNQKVLWSCIHI